MRPYVVLIAGLATLPLLAVPPSATAQSGFHPRWEIPGLDFAPDGVYRVRARQIAQARAAARGEMLRGRAPAPIMLAGPYGPGGAWTGTYAIPVLMGRPAGLTDPAFAPAAQVQAKLFGASTFPISLTTYYQQQSHGLMTVTGETFGWFALPHDTTYYTGVNGCSGGLLCSDTTAHLGTFLIDVLTRADVSVDFSQFDSDGPDGTPNSGDDDGFVDLVAILHPQIGGECQAGPVPGNTPTGYRHLWSHRWDMISLTGSAFTTNDAKYGSGFIKIRDYVLTGAEGTGSIGCTPGGLMEVGILAHEFGHGLGLLDLYDVTPAGAQGPTLGIGEWGLMGYGSYNRASSPSFMEAFSRGELGWTTEVTLSTTGVDTLRPTEVGDTVFLVNTPTAGEYFLLENRQPLESDSFVHGPGLTIYHVDRTLYNQRLFSNSVNNGTIHAVALLEADGLRQLWCATCNNYGDAGDPYPGTSGNLALSPMTTPNNLRNSGATSGFRIDSISILAPAGPVRFRIRVSGESRIAANDPAAFIQVDSVSYTLFRDIFEPGSSHEVSVADTQFSASGRTRFTFLSWSDALPRTHTFIASATGDTITATLERAHKLIATAGTGGTIVSNRRLNLAGEFIAEGNAVWLTAIPAPGIPFAGWSGDTTSSNAVIMLPMARPYTVTALFVTSTDVVAQLLGPTAPLTPAQLQTLDANGNNNGSFDIGDFLAWVKARRPPRPPR